MTVATAAVFALSRGEDTSTIDVQPIGARDKEYINTQMEQSVIKIAPVADVVGANPNPPIAISTPAIVAPAQRTEVLLPTVSTV